MKKFSELCVSSRDEIVNDLCTRIPALGEMYPNRLHALAGMYITQENEGENWIKIPTGHLVYLSEVLPFCMSLISKSPDAAHQLYSKFQSLVELAKQSFNENVETVVIECALLAIRDGLLDYKQAGELYNYSPMEEMHESLVAPAVDFVKTNIHIIRECYEILESHEVNF